MKNQNINTIVANWEEKINIPMAKLKLTKPTEIEGITRKMLKYLEEVEQN